MWREVVDEVLDTAKVGVALGWGTELPAHVVVLPELREVARARVRVVVLVCLSHSTFLVAFPEADPAEPDQRIFAYS